MRLRVIDWERPADDADSELRISTVELKKLRKSHFCIRTSAGVPLVVMELKQPGVPARAALERVNAIDICYDALP